MAQQSARRGWKNQGLAERDRAREAVMDPVRELPYRPAANGCIKRPDRWQHPTSCLPPKNCLRPRGRPQMSVCFRPQATQQLSAHNVGHRGDLCLRLEADIAVTT
jgi:hypothetical protein